MIHLTLTGYNAGQLICGQSRQSDGEYRHAVYAPLEKADFRRSCCPDCLKEMALSYDEDEPGMPEWVKPYHMH